MLTVLVDLVAKAAPSPDAAAKFAARQEVIDRLNADPDADVVVIHTRPTVEDLDPYEDVPGGVRWLLLEDGKGAAPASAAAVFAAVAQNGSVNNARKGRNVEHKTIAVDLQIKAAGPTDGLAEGQFLAYASVFDNVDSDGDVVRKGAFADTLAQWAELKAANGSVIPVLYGHDMFDPDNSVGFVVEATEDDHGLKVLGQFDLEGGNGPQVYRMVKGRRLSQLSFAYDVLDSKDSTLDGVRVRELLKLKLYEVSLVPIGANQTTEVLAVKAAERWAAKSGRVLSAKNEGLVRAAWDALGSVLAANTASDDEPKDEAKDEPKSDDAPAAKGRLADYAARLKSL